MPSMPRIPGLYDLVGLLQQQTEALAALPRTMLDLNRSILGLIEVVASARDTLASSQRVSARLERIVDEMEEPILALKPGLARLAVVLDDPAVDSVPDTLRKINEDVLPLVHGIRETQGKVNNIAALAEETSTRLAGLPGAGFLLGRRARSAAGQVVTPVTTPEGTPVATIVEPPVAPATEPGTPATEPADEPQDDAPR
jgi:ABC-type transporter Mla subunit MlaD